MSLSRTIRCDQCGRMEDDAAAREKGWRRVLSHEPISSYLTGRLTPAVDLCSWACVRDYATVQVLDPSPERP